MSKKPVACPGCVNGKHTLSAADDLLLRIDILRYELALLAHQIDSYDLARFGAGNLLRWTHLAAKRVNELQKLLHAYDVERRKERQP